MGMLILVIIDQKSITDLNQFEGIIWARHNTMKQTCKKIGLKGEEILKKKTDKAINLMIKSNKCNQCGYASSQAGNLRRHLKTHSGDKPYKCNQCGYAFSQPDHLRTHMKIHSGEKPNKCNQCEYTSSWAYNLRTHLKTHSEEKLNKCNQCDFASSRADVLMIHLKKHNLKVPHGQM